MKKTKRIKLVFYIVVLSVTFVFSTPTQAELDPRIKALGLMAVYGTVGGALLGTAALAFDYSGRSVARGASLGLYAGILFGGYIVLSHMVKNRKKTPETPLYRDDTQDNPYEGGADEIQYGEEGYFDSGAFKIHGPDSWRYQLHSNQMEYKSDIDRNLKLNRKADYTLVYLNLVNYRF